jgi:hypothetical protein
MEKEISEAFYSMHRGWNLRMDAMPVHRDLLLALMKVLMEYCGKSPPNDKRNYSHSQRHELPDMSLSKTYFCHHKNSNKRELSC